MPRVRCLPSLRESCIQLVVENIDLWCQQSTSDLLSIGAQIGNNPFDPLPFEILEDIIGFYQSITEAVTNGNKVLQHLMTPRLVSVFLPCDQELVDLALVRSPQLKYLKLFRGSLSSFPKFENLKVLVLSGNLTNKESQHSFLHVIGSYCTNLRELDISFCLEITDHDIEELCLGLNNMRRTKRRKLERCKSLQVLRVENINSRKVTKKGIKIALDNLPALRIIDHNATVNVLAEMARTNSNQMLPKFALSLLCTGFKTSYRSGNLGLAISLCPLVTSLHIEEVAGFTDRDLLSLMTLKKLQQLHIHGNLNLEPNHKKITFNGILVPLLKVIGSSLENLELYCLSDVNVHIIAECCPNLTDLILADNLSYALPGQTSFVFERLDGLEVIIPKDRDSYNESTSHHCLPRETLHSLFSSPLLKKIIIMNCDTLTDDVLLATTKIHHFENVKEIFLQDCEYVSKRGIDVFMQENNVLEEIFFVGCKNMTKENINYWENRARKKNWELCIELDK